MYTQHMDKRKETAKGDGRRTEGGVWSTDDRLAKSFFCDMSKRMSNGLRVHVSASLESKPLNKNKPPKPE